jgi:hypothetical protein
MKVELKEFKRFTLLYLLFGIFLMAVSVWNLKRETKESNRLKKVCTEQTTGIVSDYHVFKDGWYDDDDKWVDIIKYYPIFDYEVNGQKYSKQASQHSEKMRLTVGARITVCYNPDNLSDFYVPEYRHDLGNELMLVRLFCIIGFVFGVYVCFVFLRRTFRIV